VLALSPGAGVPGGRGSRSFPHRRRRDADLHRARAAAGERARPAALVLAFHGGGGNASSFKGYAGLDALADREGFVVVYPDGSGARGRRLLTWNAGACCGYAAAQKRRRRCLRRRGATGRRAQRLAGRDARLRHRALERRDDVLSHWRSKLPSASPRSRRSPGPCRRAGFRRRDPVPGAHVQQRGRPAGAYYKNRRHSGSPFPGTQEPRRATWRSSRSWPRWVEHDPLRRRAAHGRSPSCADAHRGPAHRQPPGVGAVRRAAPRCSSGSSRVLATGGRARTCGCPRASSVTKRP